MEISAFRRDSKVVEAGQWIGDIPGMGDLRLRVRGLSTPTAVAYRSRLERAVPRNKRDRDGSLKPEQSLEVFSQVLLEHVLFDWDGITQDGKPVPYSKDLAAEWLTNPDFRPFADAVAWAAGVVDRGGEETEGESVKPFPKPSPGKSNTETAAPTV
ncbi:MAG: hypothetical protein WA975_23495 [Mesorhizobium sp.]